MSYRVISERIVEERRWFGDPLIWVLVDDPCSSNTKNTRKWINQHGRSVYAHILGHDMTLMVERWKLLDRAQ